MGGETEMGLLKEKFWHWYLKLKQKAYNRVRPLRFFFKHREITRKEAFQLLGCDAKSFKRKLIGARMYLSENVTRYSIMYLVEHETSVYVEFK